MQSRFSHLHSSILLLLLPKPRRAHTYRSVCCFRAHLERKPIRIGIGDQKPKWSKVFFLKTICLFLYPKPCSIMQKTHNIDKPGMLTQSTILDIHTLSNQGCERLQLIRRQRRGIQSHLNDKRCSGGDLRERHCPDNGDSARLAVCDSNEASNMENSSHELLLSSLISDLYPYSFLKSSPHV